MSFFTNEVTQVLCVGQVVQDIVFGVDEIPKKPNKYRANACTIVGGGPAATAAVAICRLGGQARLAARIGDDHVGKMIADELKNYGVDCSLLRKMPDAQSSISTVLVDTFGERQIVNFLDPDMSADPHWLPQTLPPGISAVLVDTRWPEGSLKTLRLAREAGLPAVLDADVPIPSDGQLLDSATHVAFSKAALAGFSGKEDPRVGLRSVSRTVDAWCCVTVGAEGTLYIDGDDIHNVPAFRVNVVDTLGAGDVWHGAFALAIAQGCDESKAVYAANAAAAVKVQRTGGRAGAPTRREVEEFLLNYPLGEDK